MEEEVKRDISGSLVMAILAFFHAFWLLNVRILREEVIIGVLVGGLITASGFLARRAYVRNKRNSAG